MISAPAATRGAAAATGPWIAAAVLALYALTVAVNLEAPVEVQQDGLLSYGIWRVLAGETPLVDFRSYDPGRYYWGAAIAALAGDSLAAHRLGAGLFGALGIVLLLQLVRGVTDRTWILAGIGLLAVAWSVFMPKLYEPPLVLLGVWAAAGLLREPDARRFALAGATVTLIAFFARNHALYVATALAAIGLAVTLRASRPAQALGRNLAAGGGGLLLGAIPFVLLAAHDPRAPAAYAELVAYQLDAPAVPNPFTGPRLTCGGEGLVGLAVCGNSVALALAWALPLAVVVAGAAVAWRGRRRPDPGRPLLLASIAVTAACSPYMLTSPELLYVALVWSAALPALAVLLARLDRTAPRPALLTLGLALAVSAAATQPRNAGLMRTVLPEAYVERPSAAGRITLAAFEGLKRFDRVARFDTVARVMGGDGCAEGVFLAEDLPLLYWVWRCKAPVWDIRPLRPATPGREARLIAELERARPRWAVLPWTAGPVERGQNFRWAHPDAFAWLQRRYERRDVDAQGRLEIWERRADAQLDPRPASQAPAAPSVEPRRLASP